MIKALETNYKGYRFRSRLEARWAVYFDELGIEWQYETEGFLLPSGPYLPDFFLPQFELWFEVKGKRADAEERQRCRELSYGDYCVLLAEGNIGEHTITLFCFDLTDSSGGPSEWTVQPVICSGVNSLLPMLIVGESSVVTHQRVLCNCMWENLKFSVHHTEDRPLDDCCTHATIAARRARFEHIR